MEQIIPILDEITGSLGVYVPNLVGALAILIFGWLAALIIAAAVQGLLRGTDIDNRIAQWAMGKKGAESLNSERLVARVVFYMLMLFVLIAFFEQLNLEIVAQPLNQLLLQVFDYIPRVFGAGLLLLIAWIIASLSKIVIVRVLSTAQIDEKLESQAGLGEHSSASLTHALAEAVYWIVFLLFLPAILDALQVEGLLIPVQSMTSQILAYLPNLFGAGLVLLVGWFAARIVQKITTNLLASVGVDRLSRNAGMKSVLGGQQLSVVIGFVAYVFILIPVLLAALDALSLDAITRPVSNMLGTILGAIPAIFAAVLVLAFAYLAGRVVAGLVTNLLVSIGFDNVVGRLGVNRKLAKNKEGGASAYIGYIVLVAIMLFALIESFELVGFGLLAELTVELVVFVSHILFGIVILAIGLYIANLAAKGIEASRTHHANFLATASRVSILLLAGAMALRQMGLANEIITLAFGLILGSVAISFALAMGLGGRDVAAKHLDGWVKSMKKKR